MRAEYDLGFSAGRDYAFDVIMDFIEHHKEQEVLITPEDIELEIKMIRRKAREEEIR
jgi:hypothetical protein